MKPYVVILSDSSKSEDIHSLICSVTNNEPGIPDESIECIEEKSYTKFRTTYLLSDEQVSILKTHPDIESVELEYKYIKPKNVFAQIRGNRFNSTNYCFRPNYPQSAFSRNTFTISGTPYYGYGFPWEHMPVGSNSVRQTGYPPIINDRSKSLYTEAQSLGVLAQLIPEDLSSQSSYDVLSWSKIRTKYKYNPWRGNASQVITNDNILDGRDGSDVDIVIQDTGLEKDNPDFKDASGNSRVKDIIVDGPAHIDPTYFSNNSSKTYIDWWENASNRSAQFQSIGTLTVPRFTVLLYLNYNSSIGATNSLYFSSNVGKTITQTIGGSEYTRGTIVDNFLVFEGVGNYVKVQLDPGKPHFRYYWWHTYDSSAPSASSQPCPLTILNDAVSSSNYQISAPSIAGGFVYDENVMLNNPPGPLDSTGNNTNTSTTVGNWWSQGASGSTPATTADVYDWDTSTNPDTWQGYTLEYRMGLDWPSDTHGIHCGSESAGLKCGYAPNANLWSIKTSSSKSWLSGGIKCPHEDSFDFIRLFHQNKPNNSTHGNKNPTIVNASWGFFETPLAGRSNGNTINYKYRGTTGSYTFLNTGNSSQLASTPGFLTNHLYTGTYGIGNLINGNDYDKPFGHNVFGSSWYVNKTKSEVQSASNEMVNAGVHLVVASGNDNIYHPLNDSSDPDYNNSVQNTDGDYVRVGNLGTPNETPNSINVGALSCTTHTDGRERKDYYSNKGPGVDIYAPALNTISVDGFAKHDKSQYSSRTNPPTDFDSMIYATAANKTARYDWFSGTSSAAPNVVGVMALFLQKNRTATPLQAKQWLLGTSTAYGTAGSYIDNTLYNPTLTAKDGWGDYDNELTSTSSWSETTYNVGNFTLKVDPNAHVVYSETAASFMDSNIKLLYNPYASRDISDDTVKTTKLNISNIGTGADNGSRINISGRLNIS